MSLFIDLKDAILSRNKRIDAIPVLDGALSPNNRLDQASVLGADVKNPDDFLSSFDGTFYVSSGKEILRFTGHDFSKRSVLASFDANVGGLGWSKEGFLLACVHGRGICILNKNGHVLDNSLESVDGVKLGCPLSLTTAADGTVYITDGSRKNTPERWRHDLMANQKGSGRLIAWNSSLNKADVVIDNLVWPYGVVMSHDESEVWVTEAWAHKLSAISPENGSRRLIAQNLPGYPARIVKGTSDDYWLTFFALRTQLTEFVLRERKFCKKMMEKVPSELWIGPTLDPQINYLEPVQIGRIKTLGIQKPWAPPRSYGLLVRLKENGEFIESFHSRVGSNVHGVTSVRCINDSVIVASKGHSKLVELSHYKGKKVDMGESNDE